LKEKERKEGRKEEQKRKKEGKERMGGWKEERRRERGRKKERKKGRKKEKQKPSEILTTQVTEKKDKDHTCIPAGIENPNAIPCLSETSQGGMGGTGLAQCALLDLGSL
jgi:hypothetical protein